MTPRVKLVEGQRVGKTFFVREAGFSILSSSKKQRRCIFKCVCGAEFEAPYDSAARGNRYSCGCVKKTCHIKHGGSSGGKVSKIYTTWASIKTRCYTKSSPNYNLYGGRGIGMSDEWRASFEKFKLDMGAKPSNRHSIDRIDVSKGYFKENCRWATGIEQANNKRTNLNVEYRGQLKTMAQWCREIGIDYKFARQRYACQGKSMEITVVKGIMDMVDKNRFFKNTD